MSGDQQRRGGEQADEIGALRLRIDGIDDQILTLISERARHAQAIGQLKGDGPVYRPDREARILDRLHAGNPGPLPAQAVTAVFRQIISACRALEQPLKVAYLGPEGTFSEQAALLQFGDGIQRHPVASIDEVFRLVDAGAVQHGVVPVENTVGGAVGRTLDLLVGCRARLCGEVLLRVRQCFLARSNDLGQIRRIYIHPQSLDQCREWLDQHLPGIPRLPVASNAEAASRAAADTAAGAVAGEEAGRRHGLGIVARDIESDPSNTTRFVVLGEADVPSTGRDKTSLILSARNRPGAMVGLLAPLAAHGVSMTRLESRPSRQGAWEYVFFVDIEGHRQDGAVAAALAEIDAEASLLKVLGSYPQANPPAA